MNLPSLALILFTSYFSCLYANIDCVDVKSLASGTGDDDKAYSMCPNTHPTMVSCGGATVQSNDLEFDGGGINIDQDYTIPRCIAQNALGGGGVYAYARCCNFPSGDVTCDYQTSLRTGGGDDDVITIHCGPNPILTHCSAYTPYKYTDGAYPGPLTQQPQDIPSWDWDTMNYPAHTQCTAQNGANNNGGTAANIGCCKSPTYQMECITRYGAPTPPLSQAQCPDGYFMAGCHGWSKWAPNAWFIWNERCYARGRYGGDYSVYAVATWYV